MRKHTPEYLAYLNSQAWQQRRQMALVRAGFCCQACGDCANLQVHHLTYVRLGMEHPLDLVVLCVDCHDIAESLKRRENL